LRHRLGIVLSGGGSRGLAHAGVLRALAEEGIEPECVAGTSSGAIIGALYAAGHPPAEMLRFFEVANPFRVSRLAVGKPGFIDGTKIAADFAPWFPDDSFESLHRTLFVTATDLVSGRLEIFSSGPLVRPLLASSSVPFVFSPIAIGDRLFADGGILDNFPVEPLIGLCDKILGVYATPLREPTPAELDSSFAVSQRALEIGMYTSSKRKFHQVDCLICPGELSRYSTFDTRRHAEIAAIGYRAARERIDEIRARLDLG
jgi:NTE family protein